MSSLFFGSFRDGQETKARDIPIAARLLRFLVGEGWPKAMRTQNGLADGRLVRVSGAFRLPFGRILRQPPVPLSQKLVHAVHYDSDTET